MGKQLKSGESGGSWWRRHAKGSQSAVPRVKKPVRELVFREDPVDLQRRLVNEVIAGWPTNVVDPDRVLRVGVDGQRWEEVAQFRRQYQAAVGYLLGKPVVLYVFTEQVWETSTKASPPKSCCLFMPTRQ
jgi:hypothetical protein